MTLTGAIDIMDEIQVSTNGGSIETSKIYSHEIKIGNCHINSNYCFATLFSSKRDLAFRAKTADSPEREFYPFTGAFFCGGGGTLYRSYFFLTNKLFLCNLENRIKAKSNPSTERNLTLTCGGR